MAELNGSHPKQKGKNANMTTQNVPAQNSTPAPAHPHRKPLFEFATVMTNRAVIGIQDSLDNNGKISIVVNDFSAKKSGGNSKVVRHNIDYKAAEVIFNRIKHNFFTGTWKDYKGSAKTNRPDGKPEARTLTLEKKENQPGQAPIKYPYSFTVARGEGKVVGAGAVTMVKIEEESNINLSLMDAEYLAIEVLDYIRNWKADKQSAQRTQARLERQNPTV